MIDVSDGVWNEAAQIAEASGVGIELAWGRLPVSPVLARFGRARGREAREFVLFGGEDYELMIAADEGLEDGWPAEMAPLHRIGRVVRGEGVRVVDGNGDPMAIRDRTFRHF